MLRCAASDVVFMTSHVRVQGRRACAAFLGTKGSASPECRRLGVEARTRADSSADTSRTSQNSGANLRGIVGRHEESIRGAQRIPFTRALIVTSAFHSRWTCKHPSRIRSGHRKVRCLETPSAFTEAMTFADSRIGYVVQFRCVYHTPANIPFFRIAAFGIYLCRIFLCRGSPPCWHQKGYRKQHQACLQLFH